MIRHRYKLISILILTIQVVIFSYWGAQKSNFNIDELYAIECSSKFESKSETGWYITESDDWVYDTPISIDDLKRQIEVTSEESLLNTPYREILGRFMYGRNYYVILNLVMSAFSDGVTSKWPGLILNIVIYIGIFIVMDILVRRLYGKPQIRALSILMFGSCAYMINVVTFIRFYAWVILMSLIILVLHLLISESDSCACIILFSLLSGGAAYISFLNSEMTMVFYGGMIISTIIVLLFTHRFKQLGAYMIIPCLAGVYLLQKGWMDILFHPVNYADNSTSIGHYVSNILDGGVAGFAEGAVWVYRTLVEQYLGRRLVLVAIVLMILLFFILNKKMKLAGNETSPESKTQISTFAGIAGIALVIYTVFCSLARFTVWRYYCFGFVLFHILIWYILDRAVSNMNIKLITPVLASVAVMTLYCIASVWLYDRISYTYIDDRELISELEQYTELDVVLVSGHLENGEVSRHEAYDCINLMNRNSTILISDVEDTRLNIEDLPENFILWTKADRDINNITEQLADMNYSLEQLPDDHVSRVYTCRCEK